VKQNVRSRFEFAVILANTSVRAELTVANPIRRAVMSRELVKRSIGENLGRITISGSLRCADDNSTSLIERADRCLYAAKYGGRIRVVCEIDHEVNLRAVA
jgi:diguanylate cyclase